MRRRAGSECAAPGAVFLLNAPFGPREVWNQLPREVQQNIDMESYRIQQTGSGKIDLERKPGLLDPQRGKGAHGTAAEEMEALEQAQAWEPGVRIVTYDEILATQKGLLAASALEMRRIAPPAR